MAAKRRKRTQKEAVPQAKPRAEGRGSSAKGTVQRRTSNLELRAEEAMRKDFWAGGDALARASVPARSRIACHFYRTDSFADPFAGRANNVERPGSRVERQRDLNVERPTPNFQP